MVKSTLRGGGVYDGACGTITEFIRELERLKQNPNVSSPLPSSYVIGTIILADIARKIEKQNPEKAAAIGAYGQELENVVKALNRLVDDVNPDPDAKLTFKQLPFFYEGIHKQLVPGINLFGFNDKVYPSGLVSGTRTNFQNALVYIMLFVAQLENPSDYKDIYSTIEQTPDFRAIVDKIVAEVKRGNLYGSGGNQLNFTDDSAVYQGLSAVFLQATGLIVEKIKGILTRTLIPDGKTKDQLEKIASSDLSDAAKIGAFLISAGMAQSGDATKLTGNATKVASELKEISDIINAAMPDNTETAIKEVFKDLRIGGVDVTGTTMANELMKVYNVLNAEGLYNYVFLGKDDAGKDYVKSIDEDEREEFPKRQTGGGFDKKKKNKGVTGETSPYYLYSPEKAGAVYPRIDQTAQGGQNATASFTLVEDKAIAAMVKFIAALSDIGAGAATTFNEINQNAVRAFGVAFVTHLASYGEKLANYTANSAATQSLQTCVNNAVKNYGTWLNRIKIIETINLKKFVEDNLESLVINFVRAAYPFTAADNKTFGEKRATAFEKPGFENEDIRDFYLKCIKDDTSVWEKYVVLLEDGKPVVLNSFVDNTTDSDATRKKYRLNLKKNTGYSLLTGGLVGGAPVDSTILAELFRIDMPAGTVIRLSDVADDQYVVGEDTTLRYPLYEIFKFVLGTADPNANITIAFANGQTLNVNQGDIEDYVRVFDYQFNEQIASELDNTINSLGRNVRTPVATFNVSALANAEAYFARLVRDDPHWVHNPQSDKYFVRKAGSKRGDDGFYEPTDGRDPTVPNDDERCVFHANLTKCISALTKCLTSVEGAGCGDFLNDTQYNAKLKDQDLSVIADEIKKLPPVVASAILKKFTVGIVLRKVDVYPDRKAISEYMPNKINRYVYQSVGEWLAALQRDEKKLACGQTCGRGLAPAMIKAIVAASKKPETPLFFKYMNLLIQWVNTNRQLLNDEEIDPQEVNTVSNLEIDKYYVIPKNKEVKYEITKRLQGTCLENLRVVSTVHKLIGKMYNENPYFSRAQPSNIYNNDAFFFLNGQRQVQRGGNVLDQFSVSSRLATRLPSAWLDDIKIPSLSEQYFAILRVLKLKAESDPQLRRLSKGTIDSIQLAVDKLKNDEDNIGELIKSFVKDHAMFTRSGRQIDGFAHEIGSGNENPQLHEEMFKKHQNILRYSERLRQRTDTINRALTVISSNI